jgi:hypothetical protein
VNCTTGDDVDVDDDSTGSTSIVVVHFCFFCCGSILLDIIEKYMDKTIINEQLNNILSMVFWLQENCRNGTGYHEIEIPRNIAFYCNDII